MASYRNRKAGLHTRPHRQNLAGERIPRPPDGVMRDAALDYAARGLPVFPCQAGGKTPLTRHGLLDASTHREHVWQWWRRWPRANIAVATGPGSGWLVVDLDGPEGRASWEQLASRHGQVSTLVQITGGLGLHLVFAYPDGVELPNTAGRLGLGIDTRGAGGYIIAAPSVHPSGRRYRWLEPQRDPTPLPSWLAELLAPPPPARPVQPPAVNGGGYWRRALQGECDRLARATVGQRNHALNRAAFRLGQLVFAGLLDREGVTAALLDAAAVCGLGESEATATIRSGLAGAKCKPRASLPARLEVGG
jgi:Bifunctional DNA primase/polymerase, N-terminal